MWLDWLRSNKFRCLKSNIVELDSVHDLKKIFQWQKDPILDDPYIYEVEHAEDAHERRIRDAECLGTVCCNLNQGNFLEIGTAHGRSTALMAKNAPAAHIYTVNLPPLDQYKKGGGKYTTIRPVLDEIGKYYRNLGLQNITQVLADTRHWKPDIRDLSLAFIDGCHDTEYVYHDTKLALSLMTKGGFILWHDFNLGLAARYPWIKAVCRGVEMLYTEKRLSGPVYHLRDSWVGIHRIE